MRKFLNRCARYAVMVLTDLALGVTIAAPFLALGYAFIWLAQEVIA